MVISEKLATLNTTKQNIKSAINCTNEDVSSTKFTDYYKHIFNIYFDYFVSSTGSDSNIGTTYDEPFLTLGKALSSCSDGSKVLIKNGTYTGSANINISTKLVNLTLIGESAMGVIFDGNNSNTTGHTFSNTTTKHTTTLKNITYKNLTQSALNAGFGSLSLIIDNCNFINASQSNGYGVILYPSNLKISNSIFINNYSCFSLANDNKFSGFNLDFIGNNKPLYSGSTGLSTCNNCYWGTSNPTRSNYGYIDNTSSFTATNNKTTPNFPDRITALGYTY